MKNIILKAVIFLCVPAGILTTAILKREPMYQGKPAGIWVDELRLNRDSAMNALHHLGKAAVPALRAGLNSRAPTDKCRAAWALGNLGPVAGEAVPDLIQTLDDGNPGVENEAMEALSRIGLTDETIVPKLLAKLTGGLTDPFAATLLNAIEQARQREILPPVSGDAFAYDMAFLKSGTPVVRLNGAIKLAVLARKDDRAKAALQTLLEDENQSVRVEAAHLMTNPAALPNFRMVVF